ncbi:MAG: PhoH-like ATPase [Patescibacteria group bacterium]|nr:PhoH-like ATPase [Patescibacteria group bacterium]
MSKAKIYVLDTNVLLHNPEALFDFQDNEVVIPFVVLGEIDEHKKRQDEIGRNARKVNRYLDDLRSQGSLSEGVSVGKGIVRIELNNVNNSGLPKNIPSLNMNKPDNRILAVALGLKHGRTKNQTDARDVILVSKDLNLRVRADVCGIKADDYRKDRVDYGDMYAGFSMINFSEQQKNELRKLKATNLVAGQKAFPNQFFICETEEDDTLVACFKSGLLVSLDDKEDDNWGLKPLNVGQRMAQELLMDDAIPVVSIIGPAGTGKTLLSLAVGMEAVVEKRRYDKLVVVRPLVPMGNDIGYLPGSKVSSTHFLRHEL